MNYLIIDDDLNKVKDFIKHLEKDDVVKILNNYRASILEIRTNTNYDAIILDMNFPLRENEEPESMLGMDFLVELKRKELDIPVVVFSSNNVDTSKYENVIKNIKYDCFISLEEDVREVSKIVRAKGKTR